MKPIWTLVFFLTVLLSGFESRIQVMTVVRAESKKQQPFCPNWKTIPLKEAHFVKAYDGFGQIHFKKGLTLQPRSIASVADGTHAALALLNDQTLRRNFGVRVKYQNEKTFREPAANTWEVFWLFFNYQAQEKGKRTNYFIFKPNGVELGKAWGEIDQEFLQTANSPRAQIGKNYELTLFKKDQSIQAYIDGQMVLNFKADSSGKKLFDEAGQIGLYSEDALVRIHQIDVCDSGF